MLRFLESIDWQPWGEIPFPHVTLYAGEAAQGTLRHSLVGAGAESGQGDHGAAS